MIDQLTASYSQNEDRVLFKFNTKLSEEYAFWLSRKVVKQIMNVMPRHTQEGLAVFQKLGMNALLRLQRLTNQQNKRKCSESGYHDLSRTKSEVLQKKDTFKPGETFPLGKVPILVVGFKQKKKTINLS